MLMTTCLCRSHESRMFIGLIRNGYTNLTANPDITDVYSPWKCVALVSDRLLRILMHYYSVILMSIGAVRMHRGLADHGHQARIVDTKGQSVKTAIQLTCSSHPIHSEKGTHGTGGGVFTSLRLILPEVKWLGGEHDGSREKEAVSP
jgi:hypothetical protein